MVMMQIAKVVTQMTVLLKTNLEHRRLLLSQSKQNILPGKKLDTKNGNGTKDKLLPCDDNGKEADEELFSATNLSTAACNKK